MRIDADTQAARIPITLVTPPNNRGTSPQKHESSNFMFHGASIRFILDRQEPRGIKAAAAGRKIARGESSYDESTVWTVRSFPGFAVSRRRTGSGGICLDVDHDFAGADFRHEWNRKGSQHRIFEYQQFARITTSGTARTADGGRGKNNKVMDRSELLRLP
jgi:hypothetical protein